MKLYPVLPLLLLLTAVACSDADKQSESLDSAAGIVFGVSASDAASRADSYPVKSPDMISLLPGADCRGIAPVDVYITQAPLDAPEAAPAGRGTPVAGAEALTAFDIYAFYYKDATSSSQRFFSAEPATNMGDYWATGTKYYWPTTEGSTLSFWAMAGAEAPGVTVTTAAVAPEDMAIDYSVPAAASDQADLLLATTSRLNTPGVRVPLVFKHLCAGVRFVFGAEMQPGTIKSISISGVMSQGRYTDAWSALAAPSTFTINTNKATSADSEPGSPITPDYNTLMMLPQTLADGATLTVSFHDGVTGTDRTLTASLAGQQWKQGSITTYHIGISPEYKLEFTQPVEQQDAHYVICNSAIRVSGLPADKSWTLTIDAPGLADIKPSVQPTADINEFVKQGFWTDLEMRNGTEITTTSARGSATLKGTGSGEVPLTVFLPENATDATRTYTLTLNVDGAPARNAATQQISQLPPLNGWEQLDDNISGAYGFSYTAHHVYVYGDGFDLTESSKMRAVEAMINSIITQYNASGYVDQYKNWYLVKYRYALDINYEKLSNLGLSASSETDGYANTIQLFNFGGSAVSSTFEDALKELRRVDNQNEKAFRKRNNNYADDDRFKFPKWVEGEAINESQALTLVLKKNRYFLNRYVDSGTGMETTAPRIREQDIVWYLPAYSQFSTMPASTFAASDFWSSTAYNDATQAYLGNGTPALRSSLKKIRVMRK